MASLCKLNLNLHYYFLDQTASYKSELIFPHWWNSSSRHLPFFYTGMFIIILMICALYIFWVLILEGYMVTHTFSGSFLDGISWLTEVLDFYIILTINILWRRKAIIEIIWSWDHFFLSQETQCEKHQQDRLAITFKRKISLYMRWFRNCSVWKP